jgi:uncharacterized repeat protein (TIGR03803 family)
MRRLALLLATVFLPACFCAAQTNVSEFVVHSFAGPPTEGVTPEPALVQAADGNFYGVTYTGGANNLGTVFKMTPTGTLTTLYSFTGSTDGSKPFRGLVQGGDGNFYGITSQNGGTSACGNGSSTGCGTIFKITPAGKLTTLYTFQSGTDAAGSDASLVLGSDGNFYGTLYYTPTSEGSIFQVTPAGVFTTVYGITNAEVDGGYIQAGLVEGSPGLFYGAVTEGGTDDSGVVFSVSSGGAYSLLADFGDLTSPSAEYPASSLVEGADGNFYGVTSLGTYLPVFFQVSSAGELNVTYQFPLSGNLVPDPSGAPFAATDGNFYGANAEQGSTNCTQGCGGIYSVTPAGSLTTLYNFTGKPDASSPMGAPLQGSDGDFYGVAQGGLGHGTLYKVTLDPTLPAPVQLTVDSPSIGPGDSTTLNWKVLNAFSTTMQQCYLFVTTDGTLFPLAKLTGTYDSATHTLSGTHPLTAADGFLGPAYVAVTCGGVESGYVTVFVDAPSESSLAVTPASPIFVGQVATLTATVTGDYGTPAGNVIFSVGGDAFATVALNASGVAVIKADTRALVPGTYKLTATYEASESSNYMSSTSPAVNVMLKPRGPTTTTLTVSPNPATVGQMVSVTATVTGQYGTPTGALDVYYEGNLVDSAGLSSGGVSSFNADTKFLTAGTYPIQADYGGDMKNAPSGSNIVKVTLKKADTSTVITVSPNPVPQNAPYTITVTVSRATSGTPGGSVKLFATDYINVTLPLDSSGVATYPDENSISGSYSVTANYLGDGGDNTSTSPPVIVTLQ